MVTEPLYVICRYFWVQPQLVKQKDSTPCIKWICICKGRELHLWPLFAICCCSVALFKPFLFWAFKQSLNMLLSRQKEKSTCQVDIESSKETKAEEEDAKQHTKTWDLLVSTWKDLRGTNTAQRQSQHLLISWWEGLIGWYFLWA